jgi:hypothetical protein
MQTENKSTDDVVKQFEQNDAKSPVKSSPNTISKSMIAGILLLVAGVLSIFFWLQFFSLNATTLESLVDIQQLQNIDPSLTPEKLVDFLSTCAIVGCILSIFPILGGLLALKKKMWGISLACSIIGLFTLGLFFTSSGFSLIALILLILSKQEFY